MYSYIDKEILISKSVERSNLNKYFATSSGKLINYTIMNKLEINSIDILVTLEY